MYDILEAICAFLNIPKGKMADILKKQLNLEKKDLIIFKLANNEIMEGRHSGKDYLRARNITSSEKAEAKAAAKKIMLAFFKKLMDKPQLIEKLNHK